jgi:hypothetical protein
VSSTGSLEDRWSAVGIQYIDYGKDQFPSPVYFYTPAFFKQRAFEYEREVRLFAWRPRGFNHPTGLGFSAEPTALITKIVISPFEPKWFRDMIRAVVPQVLPAVPIEDSSFDVLLAR